MKTKKPRMSKEALAVLRSLENYTLSLLDGKQHGVCGGCIKPIGKNIFVESWILPRLAEFIEYGKGNVEIKEWMYL